MAGATGRVGRPLVEVLEAGGHDVVPMPGPDAVLAGPTFEQWLDSTTYRTQSREDSWMKRSPARPVTGAPNS